MSMQTTLLHPVDQSSDDQHQLVTATGESSIIHIQSRSELIKGCPVLGLQPESKICFEKRKTVDTQTFPRSKKSSLKVKAPEIDVGGGVISQTPGRLLVTNFKKQLVEDEDTEDEDTEDNEPSKNSTFSNLNVSLRPSALIVKSDKESKKKGVRVDDENDTTNYSAICPLDEDNFQDFSHLDSRIYDNFQRGCVVLGTKNAVRSLLDTSSSLDIGTHGVMVELSLKPSYEGLFEEGKTQQFTVVRAVGSGTYGSVSLCCHQNGQQYVRKVIKDKFRRSEVEVLASLSHPNITSFFGYILRDNCHEIIMEDGGDSLKNVVSKNRRTFRDKLTDHVVSVLAEQGYSALAYIYEQFGILHMDIKPENVLVRFDPATLKLTDFGTSKTPQQAILFDGWTPEYMSPESCRLCLASKVPCAPANWKRQLTDKTDVYAFSLTVHFMLAGNHAVCAVWPPNFDMSKLSKWRIEYIQHLARHPGFTQTLGVKEEFSKEFRDLLTSGLEADPENRVSASEACTYIRENMLQRVNIPNVLDSGLPSLTAEEDDTSMDISLQKSKHIGGGKEIKLKLQRKLRRKSANPYQRDVVDTSPTKYTVETGRDDLPNFDLFM